MTSIVAPFDGQRLSFEHSFEGQHACLPQVSRSTLRFLDAAAVEEFLGRAGLCVEERYGGFDRAPLSVGAPEIVTIARVQR